MVRFNHPAFATRNVDWDAPFIKALPKVEAAADDQEAAAIGDMLRSLGDPATRVAGRPPSPPEGAKPEVKWLENGVPSVTLARPTWQATNDLLRELGEALPGGIYVCFSGTDVRPPDGGQVQRVGLRPNVEARPTIRGLQAGRDEVLERALRLVREGRLGRAPGRSRARKSPTSGTLRDATKWLQCATLGPGAGAHPFMKAANASL